MRLSHQQPTPFFYSHWTSGFCGKICKNFIMHKNKIIIIGLGNELISDDGVGIFVLQELKSKLLSSLNVSHNFVFQELSVGGLSLLDYISGFSKCLIVDTILTRNQPPGTIYRFKQNSSDELVKIKSSHQINLPQVIGLANLLNIEVPDEIIIYGIEGEDITTFKIGCTEKVQEAIPKLVDMIYDDLMKLDYESIPSMECFSADT